MSSVTQTQGSSSPSPSELAQALMADFIVQLKKALNERDTKTVDTLFAAYVKHSTLDENALHELVVKLIDAPYRDISYDALIILVNRPPIQV